jgi:uncharacterized protein
MTSLVERVREAAYRSLNRSKQSIAHRVDHIERVMRNAALIASSMEDVDRELLELAVLLHDVDQPIGQKQEHVRLSILAAEKILQQAGCTQERASQVLRVIAEHSTEHVETVKPTSTEAKILFDADKLDGLGAVGLARVFAFYGQMLFDACCLLPPVKNVLMDTNVVYQPENSKKCPGIAETLCRNLAFVT